ncbi:unnamed protein product, partial [marine sediment metagenome]
ILVMLPYSPVLQEISTIYSKEYVVESVRPKVVWTVEHEIVEQEIMFLVIGLFMGIIVESIVVNVIIFLFFIFFTFLFKLIFLSCSENLLKFVSEH